MNIDMLDGYEFEEVVCTLFQKMGFSAEQTKLSGDGGVDIIATSTAPIYKGTYLVQCKRFSGTVGEPTVRDLFGVVTSQNANKGIVITNSTYTKGAIEFAEGKNIELVDGDGLNSLLYKYELATDVTVQHIHFTDSSDFDVSKYNYLKKLVATNKTKQEPYIALFNFLYDYVVIKNTEIMYGGLILECLQLSEDIVKRFAKKKNDIARQHLQVQCFLHLLLGNVEKLFEISKMNNFVQCMNSRNSLRAGPMFSHARCREVFDRVEGTVSHTMEMATKGSASDDFYRNLLVLFLHLDFSEGVIYCKRVFDDNFLSGKKGDEIAIYFVLDYAEKLQENICLFNAQYEAVINKDDSRIYGVTAEAMCCDEYSFSIEDIVSKWSADVNIEAQLNNIAMMLDF